MTAGRALSAAGQRRALRTALLAARAAGRAAMRHFRSPRLAVRLKPDGSQVTSADRAADLALHRVILHAFPHHGLLSEESGLRPGDGRHLWIADPVDGTRGLVRGTPHWAVLLALEVDGRLEVAVAHAPAQGRTLWALRGRGAFEDGRRLRVSRRRAAGAWILHGPRAPFLRHGLGRGLDRLALRAGAFTGASDALGYAAVAGGQAEAFVEAPGPEAWDLAAPRLLVEEAGGRFTNLRGEPTHRGPGALASNGAVHRGVLACLGPGRKSG